MKWRFLVTAGLLGAGALLACEGGSTIIDDSCLLTVRMRPGHIEVRVQMAKEVEADVNEKCVAMPLQWESRDSTVAVVVELEGHRALVTGRQEGTTEIIIIDNKDDVLTEATVTVHPPFSGG